MTCPFHGIEAPCHVCGIARVRAAIVPPPSRDDPADDDPVRARAIQRARELAQQARAVIQPTHRPDDKETQK
jgi:hypothetical protein